MTRAHRNHKVSKTSTDGNIYFYRFQAAAFTPSTIHIINSKLLCHLLNLVSFSFQ